MNTHFFSFLAANCNISLTQAITFGAYAISAKISGSEPFSAAQAITALSILGVLMDPLSHLLGNLPHSFSVIGCFKRVQDFLLLAERKDGRNIPQSPSGSSNGLVTELAEGLEMQALGHSISILDGHFNWGDKQVLREVTASFPQHHDGTLTLIVGPIGCGKSSLLKAILGEATSVNGAISLSSADIAYCEQTPWVMNATIRANIIAQSGGFDSVWFDTVVEACDLAIDMARLPEGDLTVVGDKGVKLSGGQKQRIVSKNIPYCLFFVKTERNVADEPTRLLLAQCIPGSRLQCLTTSLAA